MKCLFFGWFSSFGGIQLVNLRLWNKRIFFSWFWHKTKHNFISAWMFQNRQHKCAFSSWNFWEKKIRIFFLFRKKCATLIHLPIVNEQTSTACRYFGRLFVRDLFASFCTNRHIARWNLKKTSLKRILIQFSNVFFCTQSQSFVFSCAINTMCMCVLEKWAFISIAIQMIHIVWDVFILFVT